MYEPKAFNMQYFCAYFVILSFCNTSTHGSKGITTASAGITLRKGPVPGPVLSPVLYPLQPGKEASTRLTEEPQKGKLWTKVSEPGANTAKTLSWICLILLSPSRRSFLDTG